jgi:hypothetical protein
MITLTVAAASDIRSVLQAVRISAGQDSITDARRAQQGPQSLVNALSILESVRAGAGDARMIFR